MLLPVALSVPLDCVQDGDECTGGKTCCGHAAPDASKCLPVNQWYSKCVYQPHCAADHKQCAGKGDSVMDTTPCCTAGFVCKATNEWWSSCVEPSTPTPAPPPQKCTATGAQCGPGSGFKPCCEALDQCEVVNQYFLKCVTQPTCAKIDDTCAGTGDHVMQATPCCDSGAVCTPWGEEWSTCRDPKYATCSRHEEQCKGTGGSAMKEKPCCDPSDTCVTVNQWYSKCDSKPSAALMEDPAEATVDEVEVIV